MNGTVKWIGVRPEKKAPIVVLDSVFADQASGLAGDRESKAHRQVTLVFDQNLENVAQALGRSSLDPGETRRNILITGRTSELPVGTQITIGEAILEVTGPCLPCSRMEETIGEGGRMAMAQNEGGGVTTKIVRSGTIRVGDAVSRV